MQSATCFTSTALRLLPSMLSTIDTQISEYDKSRGSASATDDACNYLRRNVKAKQVLAICSMVPKGKVTTYGTIGKILEACEEIDIKEKDTVKESRKAASTRATKLRGSRYSRFVGSALGKNPFAPMVPCHRVVAHDGKLNGFAGGLCKKVELLTDEGVTLKKIGNTFDTCVVDDSFII